MKKLFLIAFIAIGTMALMSFAENTKDKVETTTTLNTDYMDGWNDGFCEGWKDVKGQFAICPIAPIAPVPKVSCYEGYKCGYNRGFKYGMCKAREGSCEK